MSADNAIAVLRTRKPGGGYQYRLAEYGVSSEIFVYRHVTPVAVQKAADLRAVASMFVDQAPEEEQPFLVIDGFVAVNFRDVQHCVNMFSRSPVFEDERAAMAGAAELEERIGYVEYGCERICIDSTWAELVTRAEALRQRRHTCKVLGPDSDRRRYRARGDEREEFYSYGGPGIEDKLAKEWGWEPEVVEAVMQRVRSKFFDYHRFTEASHLRIARVGNAEEEARYERMVANGCCQRHDEEFVVDTLLGQVRVRFGFNHGH